MLSFNQLNLASILECAQRDYPEKAGLIFNGKEYSYQNINGMSNRIANGLTNHGIGKGDRVAMSCPNLPYFPMIYYGIIKTGAAVVPLNVLLKRKEITYHLKDSESTAYFCFKGTEELAMAEEGYAAFSEVDGCEYFWTITQKGENSPVEDVPTLFEMMGDNLEYAMEVTEASDPACVLYTSGTTGKPKGAELSHMNIFMNAMACNMLFNSRHEDIQLITLPLFHTFGQVVQMNAGMMQAMTNVLIPKFDPGAVLSSFEEYGVTMFAGVPTMYWELLNYKGAKEFDLDKISSNLRLGVSAGSSMPVEVMESFKDKYGVDILEGYGLSETGPGAAFSRLSKEHKPGSIGVPIQGVEMKLIDEDLNDVEETGEIGEIVIRGHNVMLGYLNKPEANEKSFIEGGWFRTGDLGKKDEDGYYYILDRLKDMIIRGGYNVYPREVEEMMMEHPAISLAAVVGEKDEQYGEEVAAYVILKEGKEATAEELIDWAKSEMASYKYPRKIYIKDDLPLTATGKVLKRELKNS